MRSAFPLFAALALSACASLPAAVPVRSDGLAHLHEATRVGSLVVTPRAVIEDSRCPAQVQCVWAGRVRIRALIGGTETRELSLGEPVAVSGGTVTLVDVRPGKRTPEAVASRDYRFTFRFQRP